MNEIKLFIIILCLALGLGGWIIHFYTLIRSALADERWCVKVMFNDYHEGIAEIVVFATIIITTIFALIYVFDYALLNCP